MKSFLRRILSFALILSMSLPLGLGLVSAEESSLPPENLAASLVWDKLVGTPSVTQTATGAIMKGLSNSWDSVGVDVLPALRKVVDKEDEVVLKLSVSLKATMMAGSERETLSVRPLIRGTSAVSGLNDAEWNSRYADTLEGDPAVMGMYGGNIMGFIDEELSLTHDTWRTYETTMELTRRQVRSSLLTEWIFCVDNLYGMDREKVEAVEFKDLSIQIQIEEEIAPPPPENNDHLITEYQGEVWSPVEVTLWSGKVYKNPYLDAEIDGVFTHTDGTRIAIPGFWKEGQLWALRFSPTKTGEWHYEITCSDEKNSGLFKSGTIQALEPTKDTDLARHGFVTVKEGQHYYSHADGTPFFWLGDTNWQAFTNLSTTTCNYPGCSCGSQFKHIVDNRLEKGFTVYQTYFVPEAGNGEKPLWLDGQHRKPDTEVFNTKVDEMFAYLHDKGQVIALGLGCHTSTMSRMRLEDLLRFTRYVVARYACYSVVWISGQEITDEAPSITPGYSAFDCYLEASALIEQLDGYGHPNSAHMYPMPIEDERAQRLDRTSWHDSWTLQGGHCMVQPATFYQGYYEARNTGVVKPFVEGETNYEDINCGGFTGYDLNRYSAWNAMLCGSAGFTYGVTGIWASAFSTSNFVGWLGETTSFSYDPWYMGLDKPGSFEMAYMKRFFTAIGPWYDLIPHFDNGDSAPYLRRGRAALAATQDASLIVSYFFNDTSDSTGTICILSPERSYDAYWFDPRTGKFIPLEEGITAANGEYKVPKRPTKEDWVLLLTAIGLGAHYEETLPEDQNPTFQEVPPTGSPVTPVDVVALGGITYRGNIKDSQSMTDPTIRLYDGDISTVWTPFAQRTTQTLLFDLGTPHSLSHMTITPAEGTVLPNFRIYGSNDKESWTILVDTARRDVPHPGMGSEPLKGTYRYVKLLLLNPESVNVGEDQLSTLPYKAMYNPMSGNSYSVTRIAEITLYSLGEGEPTPDIWVDPHEETSPPSEQETLPDEDTPSQTTSADTEGEETTAEPPRSKGCRSLASASILLTMVCMTAGLSVLRIAPRARSRKEE